MSYPYLFKMCKIPYPYTWNLDFTPTLWHRLCMACISILNTYFIFFNVDRGELLLLKLLLGESPLCWRDRLLLQVGRGESPGRNPVHRRFRPDCIMWSPPFTVTHRTDWSLGYSTPYQLLRSFIIHDTGDNVIPSRGKQGNFSLCPQYRLDLGST
jgi:hypothetical protein